MDPLWADTLAVTERRAFAFFSETLGESLGDDRRRVSRDEFFYVVSVLAHYSLVGNASTEHLPIPPTLRTLHDLFVTDFSAWDDVELMETAAAQTLILTGYFAKGMRRRHHLGTYVDWGRFFYGRAASGTTGRKQVLLEGMRRHFVDWRDHLERLHAQLLENVYVLTTPSTQRKGGLVDGTPG